MGTRSKKKHRKSPLAKGGTAVVAAEATAKVKAAGKSAIVRAAVAADAVVAKAPVNTLKRRGYFAGQEIVDRNRQHMEPDELQKFFKFMPPTSFWYPYFYIQYFFGCRLSEPALLLEEDVDMVKKQIIIKRLKKAKEQEGYREHVYAIDDRVMECVKTALAWKVKKKIVDNPFLFPSNRKRDGTHIGAERLSQLRNLDGYQAVSRFTSTRMYRYISEQIKLPQNLQHSHVLRHTRATLMLASGASIEQVMYLLGHSSPKMTQRYVGIAASMSHKLNADILKMGLGV